jgi:hypothetical protein
MECDIEFRRLDLGGGQPLLFQCRVRFGDNEHFGKWETIPPHAMPVIDASEGRVVCHSVGQSPRPH